MDGALKWYVNRLRRMSMREIAFRALRQLGQVIEKRRVIHGWTPKPPKSVVPGRSLLPDLSEYINLWNERYELDKPVLNSLASGALELFGHHKVQLTSPIDWQIDPLSGVRAPGIYGKSINYRNDALLGDVKVVWEIGRHHHLIPLAVAYAITGEKCHLKAITTQIESWIAQNPFGIGIHWCSSLELALRMVSWAIVHSLIASRDGDRGLFDAVKDSEALGDVIYQHAWFVRHYLSRHSSAANHLVGELTGLWVASHVFDLGVDGEQWRDEAKEELERELQLQVSSDGVGREQALYYHLWVLEYALFLQVAGERVGSPWSGQFCKQIARMADFVRNVTPPGGKQPQIGDADDGFVTRFSAAWPNNPYKDVLDSESLVRRKCEVDELAEKAFWYGIIGGCSDVLSRHEVCGCVHRPYPRVYAEGGYSVLGNKDCHLVFDAGSLGYQALAGHGHADALSFTLAIDGDWWLVDPGTYIYHQMPEWRNYFRSTRAHNCVVVDGKDQSTICGPFMWSKHANASLVSHGSESDKQWVKGVHDGYRDVGVTHYREIELYSESQRIDIVDGLEGEGRHRLEIWIQCAPDVRITRKSGEDVWELRKKDSSRVVRLQLDPCLEWDILRGQETPMIAGWYSSKLGSREPSCTIHGYTMCDLPKRVVTSIMYG